MNLADHEDVCFLREAWGAHVSLHWDTLWVWFHFCKAVPHLKAQPFPMDTAEACGLCSHINQATLSKIVWQESFLHSQLTLDCVQLTTKTNPYTNILFKSLFPLYLFILLIASWPQILISMTPSYSSIQETLLLDQGSRGFKTIITGFQKANAHCGISSCSGEITQEQ